MTKAIYDLGKYPTNFDFLVWAVYAKTWRTKHVHFVTDNPIQTVKYPKHIAWKRFGNITIPICRIAGFDFTVGKFEEGFEFPYYLGTLLDLYNGRGKINLLEPNREPYSIGKSYITITLRQSFRNQHRDSNLQAWKEFEQLALAKGLGVIVFPECEHAPLDVEFRMSVYAGAMMNYGVATGPMGLCTYSKDIPYRLFQWSDEEFLKLHNFPHGSQFPWRKDDSQLVVYEKDDLDNLKKWLI